MGEGNNIWQRPWGCLVRVTDLRVACVEKALVLDLFFVGVSGPMTRRSPRERKIKFRLFFCGRYFS